MRKRILILSVLIIFTFLAAFSQILKTEKIKTFLNNDIADSLKIKIYEYLAEDYYIRSFDSAIFFIDEAILISKKDNSQKTKAKLLALKAKYLVENGMYEEALQINNVLYAIYKSSGNTEKLGNTIVEKGVIYDYLGDYPKAMNCYDSAIAYANKVNNKKVLALALNRYGIIYEEISQFHKAIELYKKSLAISIETNYENEIKNNYNSLGISYYYLGDYQHSLEFYQKFLDYSEKQKSLKDIAYAYGNIGMIYEAMKDFNKALFFYQKSLSMHRQLNFKPGIANSLTCLGDIKASNKKYEEALKDYMLVLKIAEEINDVRAKSFIYGNIGNVYYKQKKYDAAINSFKTALGFYEKLNVLSGKSWNYLYLGEVYYEKHDLQNAFQYFKMSYDTALVTGEKEIIKNSAKHLSELYHLKGDFKNAYYFLNLFKTYSDSLVNADKIRDITALDIKYQNDKERQLEKLQQQQKDLEFQKKITKQKIFIYSFILGLVFMLIIAIIILRNLKYKQKLNNILKQQRKEILLNNSELVQMNHEILTQNEEISKRNNNITDSLKYAQKIQSALFPQQHLLKTFFEDGFVIHRPLEIVSGDFYWIKKINNKVVVAVADCTGHGVPGAFMSVIGIAYLNEIAREKYNQETGMMLDKLRIELKQSLEHSEYQTDTRDGMDIALCAINKETLTAQYSGAINNLYLIRNNKLIVYKGDPQHIGIYDEEKAFTNFDIQLQQGDVLYMFTDGYVDQFGGKDGRKFLIKHFKQLLLEINHLPMEEQNAVLENTLNNWQKGYQQVDDILVMGIKI